MNKLLVVLVALAGLLPAQFFFDGPLPPVPVPPDNPQTDAKVRLGKQLYFDPRLSADQTISCATCHDPATGWANHGPVDVGIGGQKGTRNSGTIIDSAHMRFQFWDGRAGSLEEQALGPIHNPVEMGETLENVVAKLNAVPGYREQFQEVFGTEVTAQAIGQALASFERTILSGPNSFDRYQAGEQQAISPAARRGAELFNGKAHCSSCHSGPVFSDQSFHNLGIGMDRANPDLGREAITNDRADRGRFKTPGLRNVAQTSPYLHDGSEKSLADVIALYDRGGVPNPDLDPLMVPLALSSAEQRDLVAFLEALTGPVPQVEPPELPGGVAPVFGPKGGER